MLKTLKKRMLLMIVSGCFFFANEKFVFIFLASILLANTGYSQDKTAQYYKTVNKAELSICKAKYQSASKYYQKAFETEISFQKDLWNAFKLDYRYVGKEDNALEYAHKLVQRRFYPYFIIILRSDFPKPFCGNKSKTAI